MEKQSVLIVEDSIDIANQLCRFLQEKGFIVDYAQTGGQALQLLGEHKFDLVILDLTLPDCDGLELCGEIKEGSEVNLPILMLTARDSLDDKVKGFTAGTDDYLTKPFALEEVWMRCLSLCRRNNLYQQKKLSLGSLSLDPSAHTVTREQQDIHLSVTEFSILKILLETYPNAVSKRQLTYKLWGEDAPPTDVLRSHIYTLRNAVDKPFKHAMIKTVHGIGFRLEAKHD